MWTRAHWIPSAFAWRNFNRNSELRIRLLKAGEMNAHLARMNLVAAGLAHDPAIAYVAAGRAA